MGTLINMELQTILMYILVILFDVYLSKHINPY